MKRRKSKSRRHKNPNVIRCFAVFPFNIICIDSDGVKSNVDLKPVTIKIDDIGVKIHPPSRAGGDKDHLNIVPARFKDTGLDFTNSCITPEDQLPSIKITRNVKEASYNNAIKIDFQKNTDKRKVEKLMNNIVEKLLDNIRIRTRQYWIDVRLFATSRTYQRYEFERKGSGWKFAMITRHPGDYPLFTEPDILEQRIFEKSIDDMFRKEDNFEEHKFLDASRNYFINQRHKAILDLAMSAEISKNKLLDRIKAGEWTDEPIPSKEFNECFSGFKLYRHIGKHLLKSPVNRSFCIDHTDEYQEVVRLWKFRNQIAHGCKFLEDTNGKRVNVDKNLFSRLVKACDVLRNYCHNLQAN